MVSSRNDGSYDVSQTRNGLVKMAFMGGRKGRSLTVSRDMIHVTINVDLIRLLTMKPSEPPLPLALPLSVS